MGAFEEKDKERRVSEDLSDGDFVDFYIAGSWQEGQVIDIKEERGEVIIVVKSTDDSNLGKELKLHSRLLAKHRSFTKEAETYERFVGGFRLEISGIGQFPIFVFLYIL